MIPEIAHIVKEIAGNEYLHFDTELKVKMNPHDHNEVSFWAVAVSPSNQVWVMCADETWWPVEQRETALISSLYQRVSIICKQSHTSGAYKSFCFPLS